MLDRLRAEVARHCTVHYDMVGLAFSYYPAHGPLSGLCRIIWHQLSISGAYNRGPTGAHCRPQYCHFMYASHL